MSDDLLYILKLCSGPGSGTEEELTKLFSLTQGVYFDKLERHIEDGRTEYYTWSAIKGFE